MAGLRKIAKMYGGMKINGVSYSWDYDADEPVPSVEMPIGSDRWHKSEAARWDKLLQDLNAEGWGGYGGPQKSRMKPATD